MFTLDVGDRTVSRGVCDVPFSAEAIVSFIEDPNNVKLVDVMNE
jgi:hypothetical protein